MGVFELTLITLKLVLIAWFLAIITGIPLGIAITRTRMSIKKIILWIVGIIETVPFIAMLAIMVPLLFSNYSAVIFVLFLYALLPLVVNTYRGIENVDTAIKEAARGMGMSGIQQLLRVELPLALPMIITGMQIAVVYEVGIAPLSALVGVDSLGIMLFKGAQRLDFQQVAVATIILVVMGLVLPRIVGLSKRALRWQR